MALTEIISTACTEDKLRELLKKEGDFDYKGYEFVGGFSKKGDSYLSEVFRLRVDGEKPGATKCLNFVVKALPKNIGRRRTYRSTDFFSNEIAFYDEIIPAFEEFQARKNAQNPFREYARCFLSFCDGEQDYLALDDLTKYGYEAADRQDGLDFAHCILAMESLGRFHGVSLAMKDQEPENFRKIAQKVTETYYSPHLKGWYNDFQKTQIMVAKDAVGKEYPGTKIEEKMLQFTSGELYDLLSGITHADSPLAVIGHGDCWAPNFLIKYASGRVPKEMMIIDFQLARYATIACDLSFFIYSCTSQALREEHYDDLLRAYHASCCKLLEDLGSKAEIFPYSALEEEMQKYARFGVGMGMESIPFSVMPEDDTFDLDSIQGDKAIPLQEIWVLKPIPTKEGRLRVADMFKHATERGYLD
uniref:Putative juvenile hormone-inducible protein n=1 Tax=Nyssomyia neivai TaxID=330878 RepID=A0A1L8DN26_9DIPT